MKKLLLLTAALSSLLFTSCNEDDAVVLGPNNTIVGFNKSAYSQNFFTDITDAELKIPITLISYVNEQYPASDITLNWKIVPNDSDLTDDAVDGVEYDAPAGGSGTAVIPLGESTASLSVNVHPNTFDPDAPKKLTVLITSAGGALVGKQYEKVVVTLQGVCPSALEGNYLINNNPAWDAVNTNLGNGVYNCSRLPYLTAGGSAIAYEFSDVCGNITIDTTVLGGGYYVGGSGVVNPDGSITITYRLHDGATSSDPVLFDYSSTPATYFPQP